MTDHDHRIKAIIEVKTLIVPAEKGNVKNGDAEGRGSMDPRTAPIADMA